MATGQSRENPDTTRQIEQEKQQEEAAMATGQSRENPDTTRQIEQEKQQEIGKIIIDEDDKRINLDAHREEILMCLKKGVSQRVIAKILGCSPSTLNAWVKRQESWDTNFSNNFAFTTDPDIES